MPRGQGALAAPTIPSSGRKTNPKIQGGDITLGEHRRYRELSIDRVIEKPPRSGELVRAVKEIAELD